MNSLSRLWRPATALAFLPAFLLIAAIVAAHPSDAAASARVPTPNTAKATLPTADETLSFQLNLNGRAVEVSITYAWGEIAWAESVRHLLQRGMPALERAAGHPYPGPDSIRIAQRDPEQIHGYAGLASCQVTYCLIRVTPASDDLTLLHELAHLWTQPFGKRWLWEGYAEFVSLKAASNLGLYQEPAIDFPIEPPSTPLSDWDSSVDLLTATPEEQLIEFEGYFYSYHLFRILEEVVGADKLMATNVTLFSEQDPYSVGSRLYMDTLEDTSDVNLDDLFLDWVFLEESTSLMQQRREARDRLAALRSQAEPLGLTVDESIQENIDAWRFDDALAILKRKEHNLQAYIEAKDKLDELLTATEQAGLPCPLLFENAPQSWDFADVSDSLPQAEEAVTAYVEAKQAVVEERSLWQSIGLLGKDPEAKLSDAATHFASGRFSQSLQDSRAAQRMVDEAGTAAFERLAITLGGIISLATVALLAFWFLNRETTIEGQQIEP